MSKKSFSNFPGADKGVKNLFKDFLSDPLSWIEERRDRGIDEDEFVLFFPSLGHRTGNGWRLEVRGLIYEKPGLLQDLFALAVKLIGVPLADLEKEMTKDGMDEDQAWQIFEDRSWYFLLDGERAEHASIELCGSREALPRTDAYGFSQTFIDIDDAALDRCTREKDWITYLARDEKGTRSFTGETRLLSPNGVTVVSDVDDTIKDSNVSQLLQLVMNTLFRPFKEVPGMKDLYKSWEEMGAGFVYLTNSPYQLYEPLAQFLQGEADFPKGAYYMRKLDWKAARRQIRELVAGDDEVSSQENPKKYNLISLLSRYPDGNFILVGDSTEHDAQIYADLYNGSDLPTVNGIRPRSYKDQIARIYIRKVPGSKEDKLEDAEKAIQSIGDETIARFFTDQEVREGRLLEETRDLFK